MDRGAWQAMDTWGHRVRHDWVTKQQQNACMGIYIHIYIHMYIYSRILLSHKKKRNLTIYKLASTWSILCLVKCQTKKDKYSMLSLICGIQKIK